VSGWRLLQTGAFEAQNAFIRGRIEADSGYISSTLQIGGTSQDIGEIAQLANDAGNTAITVDNWKKPGNTFIDGNKIFTGDAYVDTLQLKGEAITILQSQTGASGSSTNGTSTLHSYTINHGVDETIPMLISFGSMIRSGRSGQASNAVNCTLGIQLNGSTVATVSGDESGLRSRSVKLNVGSGSNTLRLYFNTGFSNDGAASWKNSWLTSVGCKR